MDGVLLPAGSISGKVGRSWLRIGLGGLLTAVLAPCGGGICNVGALRELLPEPDALAIWSGLTPVLAICASKTVRKSQTGSTWGQLAGQYTSRGDRHYSQTAGTLAPYTLPVSALEPGWLESKIRRTQPAKD